MPSPGGYSHSAPPAPTPHPQAVPKKGASVSLGYSHSVPVTRNSRALELLRAALTSPESEESDVYFALKVQYSSKVAY